MYEQVCPTTQLDYRSLFEAVPDLYLVLDPEFIILTASDAYLSATMTRREELVGRSIFAAFPDNPDDLGAAAVRNLRASLNQVRLHLVEDAMPVQKYDIPRPETEGGGWEERYWSPVNVPVLDRSGSLAYIIHRVKDVTEYVKQRHAESKHIDFSQKADRIAFYMEADILRRFKDAAMVSRQLKEANSEIQHREQVLRSILDNASTVIYLRDMQGKLVVANRRFCDYFLPDGETAEGKSFFDIFPREIAEDLLRHDEAVLESATGQQCEEFLPVSGTLHPFLTARFVIRDAASNPTMLGAVSTDITELRKAQRQIDRFFDVSNNLLCIANMDGYFVRVNNAWERTLGFSRAELTSRPFTDFLHPDDLEPTTQEYERQSKGEGVISFENRYRAADGSYRTLLWNATPTMPDGHIYASAHDITERKHAELTIADLNKELEHRAIQLESVNRELEAFCYSVSHDLRAPLRAIDGFSLAIMEDCAGKLGETELSYLTRVRSGAQRMAQLIDDLLCLSRVSRSELALDNCDFSSLAAAAVVRLQERQPNRTVLVTIEPGVTVQGDQRLLSVLLDNLIGNAWKFTGKVDDPHIWIECEEAGDTKRFCIRDNGAGFDMTYVNKLFGAFQRLHTEKEFEGTGIGLATVQRIVRRHGGEIWAESKVNEGAAFYFTLQPSIPSGGKNG